MQGDDLTPELLMTKSLNDYNMKVLRKTWGQQSNDQRSIVALIAELQTIKESNIQLSASALRNIQRKTPSDTSGAKKYNPYDPKDACRLFRGEGSPTTLNKFNNTYHWCSCYKKWVTHTNEDYKGQSRANRQPLHNNPQATAPQQPAVCAAPAPVFYAATFEATIAAICEE